MDIFKSTDKLDSSATLTKYNYIGIIHGLFDPFIPNNIGNNKLYSFNFFKKYFKVDSTDLKDIFTYSHTDEIINNLSTSIRSIVQKFNDDIEKWDREYAPSSFYINGADFQIKSDQSPTPFLSDTDLLKKKDKAPPKVGKNTRPPHLKHV